jgi:hypothetical protein
MEDTTVALLPRFRVVIVVVYSSTVGSNTNVNFVAHRLVTYVFELVRVLAPVTTPPLYCTARMVVPYLFHHLLLLLLDNRGACYHLLLWWKKKMQ